MAQTLSGARSLRGLEQRLGPGARAPVTDNIQRSASQTLYHVAVVSIQSGHGRIWDASSDFGWAGARPDGNNQGRTLPPKRRSLAVWLHLRRASPMRKLPGVAFVHRERTAHRFGKEAWRAFQAGSDGGCCCLRNCTALRPRFGSSRGCAG